MLGSLMGEKSYSVLRSNTKIATILERDVVLDFGSDETQTRRSSFLGTLGEDEHRHDGIEQQVSEKPHKKEQVIKFITGSKYIGHWNQLGMSGKGVYRYPHGVIYDGYFNRNGEFHGSGMLLYPNGDRIEGIWKNGKLAPGAQFVTKENNAYDEDYCQMPDRRFQIEIQHDLQPADQEYLSNSPKAVEVPKGCYDTGIGIYDPKLRVIKSYKKPDVFKPDYEYRPWADEERNRQYKMILHWSPSENYFYHLLKRSRSVDDNDEDINLIPLLSFEQWIKKFCRKESISAVGYIPEYYEMWRTGALRENYIQTDPDEKTHTVFHPTQSIMYDMMFSPDFSNNQAREKSSTNNIKMLSQMFFKPSNHARHSRTRRRQPQNEK